MGEISDARRSEVRLAIEQGFAQTPPPDPQQLIATYDDEGIIDYFAGRNWQDYTPWDLRSLEAALSYFTARIPLLLSRLHAGDLG